MLETLNSITWWEIFIGGLSTLAIYSFLYRENKFYRFFEHLFIGIATGITVMQTVKVFLWQEIFKPMLGMDRVLFPDGTYAEPYNTNYLYFLFPIGFGLLYYCILSKRFNWIAQVVIGFSLGIGGGFAFKGFFNEVMPQLFDSFRPLYIPGNIIESLSNIIFIFTLITALSYFFFTFKKSETSVFTRSATAGRWMMMICFGAFFGTTIMARMALLVERLEFLINTWIPNLTGMSI